MRDRVNRRFAGRLPRRARHARHAAHVAQFGAKGCVTFDPAFALDVFTRFIDSVLTPSRIDDKD